MDQFEQGLRHVFMAHIESKPAPFQAVVKPVFAIPLNRARRIAEPPEVLMLLMWARLPCVNSLWLCCISPDTFDTPFGSERQKRWTYTDRCTIGRDRAILWQVIQSSTNQ